MQYLHADRPLLSRTFDLSFFSDAVNFSGQISAGQIHLDDRAAWVAQVKRLEGKRVVLELRQHKEKRSGQQNRYYWRCLEIFGEALGYDKEDLHYELRRRFLAIDPDATIVKSRSTTELNTAEFAEYMDRVIRLAAEYGCVLPSAEGI